MLDKHIDPPYDLWIEEHDLSWIDDFYEDYFTERDIEIALHNYECKVFNELDRRITS